MMVVFVRCETMRLSTDAHHCVMTVEQMRFDEADLTVVLPAITTFERIAIVENLNCRLMSK